MFKNRETRPAYCRSVNGNITANHILLSEEKNENQHDESAEMIFQQCNHALYKSWQKIELCSMDNLRKPKYPWCSDSTHHISNGLKRNTEKQRQSYFDCFFAVDCGQFMVQAHSIFTCNVLWSSSRSGFSKSSGNGWKHITIKVQDSTYLANA